MRVDRRLFCAALAFFGALVCGQAAGWFAARGEDPSFSLAANLLGQGLWALLAVSGACALSGASVSERLGLSRGRVPAASCALLIVGFVALSYALHVALTDLAVRETGTMGQLDRMVARSRGPSPGLTVLTVAVAPALAEELLFRGFVQQGLTRWLGAWIAVPIAAALFGLAHWDPVHSPAAALLGLYLGTVTALAGSIRPAIACHLVNNLLGVLVNPAAGGVGGDWRVPIAFLLALAVLALLVAARFRRGRKAPTTPEPATPGGDPERFSGGPGRPTRGSREVHPEAQGHEQPTLDTPDR